MYNTVENIKNELNRVLKELDKYDLGEKIHVWGNFIDEQSYEQSENFDITNSIQVYKKDNILQLDINCIG